MEQKNGAATASTILGIVSLVIAVIGGITFGVIGAAIALILGIVAVVLGINAKKQTGGTKGQAGFVCGLIGIIFAVIFAVGCSIYAAIGILIGSKLLYCLTRLPSLIQKWDAVAAGFDKNFMQTLLFLMNYLFGGLVFYGGLIGAFLGIFCYCKQYHLSYVPYMDVFAPLIPFVHGIGRIGCFCSGCCYGIEYHGPFAIQFPYNEAVPQLSQVPRFPVQLLEALMNFLLCGILFCLMKKKNLRNGRLMGIYLIYYSIARFLLEMLRGDKIRGSISVFSTSQLISLILLPVGIVLVRGKWVEKHCKEEKSGV